MKKGKSKKIIKTILKIVATALAVVLVLGGSAAAYFTYAVKAPLNITINKDKTLNELDGFGTSACWWSQICGNSATEEDIAKLLFSREGLGMNIFRYNVGGGEADNPECRIGDPWRAPESFYVKNEETGNFEYDFTRDANAQRFLDLALSYGIVDTVVLFANSPHYSMTASGQASGGLKEKQSNLPRENYQAFAEYFLDITQYFLDKGVPVKYISPINEPQWDWGGDWVGQEGCHYETDEIVELFEVFAREIKKRNMDVKISGPESGDISPNTTNWFKKLYDNEEIKDALGTLSYHSYWTDGFVYTKPYLGRWTKKHTPDVKIEMSEWCELPCKHTTDEIEGALIEARVIANDLQLTGVSAWSAWAGVNGWNTGDDGKVHTDGLLYANEDFSEYGVAVRYYALAHFSRFIPAGSVRLESRKNVYDINFTFNGSTGANFATNTVSYLTPDGKIVTVVVNEGGERELTFNVGAEKMNVYTSTQTRQLENTYSGKIKTIVLPEKSIMTVVFE